MRVHHRSPFRRLRAAECGLVPTAKQTRDVAPVPTATDGSTEPGGLRANAGARPPAARAATATPFRPRECQAARARTAVSPPVGATVSLAPNRS